MYSRIFFLLVIVCAVKASVYTVNVFDDNPETEIASSLKGCNPQECDQRCRRLKFPGGACVNGRCKCDNFLNVKDDVSVEEPAILKDLVSLEAEQAAKSRCRNRVCDAVCRALHNTSGACVDDHCKCTNKTLAAEDIVSDPAESLRSCNPIRCDEQCRRNGHEFGVCFKGQCKCDYFLKEEDAVNEYPQADSKRYCNLTQCNQTCANRGYDSARCIHGWCKCYNKMERQDASPLNDVTEDENEVSNDILRTVAEELSDVSPRACKSASCNQACRAFYFKGGWCRFGRCQCF